MEGEQIWLDAMTEYLPYHEDRFFLALQAAAHGAYRPQYSEDDHKPKEPGAVKALANRALDAFSNRADAAIRKYQERKAMRGR